MASDKVYFDAHILSTLPSGSTYSHIHIQSTENEPYLLFLDGFSGTSYLWRHQIAQFSAQGYGIVVPDLWGIVAVTSPWIWKNTGSRGWQKMLFLPWRHLELAHASRLRTTGDNATVCSYQQRALTYFRGSFLLSRIANYYPERFLALTRLAIAYSPPAGKFSVDDINAASERRLGYPFFGYWEFFNDPKTVELVDRNIESFLKLQFASDPDQVVTSFCPPSAARAWVTANKFSPLPAFITPKEIETYSSFFSPSHGGSFGPPLNCYKAMMANINLTDDEAIPEENYHIKKPALFIACKKDYMAVPVLQEENIRPWAKDVRVKKLDSAHWVQLQKRDEVNACLQDSFDEVLPVENGLQNGH